jgi:hypothetical protein
MTTLIELQSQFQTLHAQHEDLERRYEALRAREAIRDCIYAFCRALDRLDPDLLRSIFHPDAECDYGVIYRGDVEGFIDVAMRFQGAMRDTHHNVGNVIIRVAGASATAESYVLAHHVVPTAAGMQELSVGARYLDRFENRNGDWRIVFRTEVLDWGRMVPITERWFEDNTELPKGRRDRNDPSYFL